MPLSVNVIAVIMPETFAFQLGGKKLPWVLKQQNVFRPVCDNAPTRIFNDLQMCLAEEKSSEESIMDVHTQEQTKTVFTQGGKQPAKVNPKGLRQG